MTADPADPFGTRAIREATVGAWQRSATRLAEDTAAEAELVEIGYRDRLLTELAANAADAAGVPEPAATAGDAAATGAHGRLAVWLDPPGVLHVANTGEPLSAEGVASLSALRVSAKHGHPTTGVDPSDDAAHPAQVGRFGLGFNSVASVGVEVAIRSRCGGVVFGIDRTRAALAEAGIDAPPRLPMIRLPWPDPTPPRDGFDTEVVITLRDDVDATDLLATMVSDAPTLLLELEALQAITIEDDLFERVVTPLEGDGDLVEVGERQWTQIRALHARWLLPGPPASPRPLTDGVLHAPTRTDVALTLPAMCVADVAVTPDRRGLHPAADITTAAVGYHHLALSVDPTRRLDVVPTPGFAAGPVDDVLRTAVLDDLRQNRWLPTADGSVVAPERAVVIADATPELAAVLADLVDGLVIADLSDRTSLRALGALGVTPLPLAELCDRLATVVRPPTWWRRLYEALAPVLVDEHARGEVATIPVPRADGRMAIGARGLVLPDIVGSGSDGAAPVSISWVSAVHPDADHPLLERLGAQRLSVADLLAEPTLRAAITDAHDADDDEATALTDEVLALLARDDRVDPPEWVRQLLVADTDGELRPADELLLLNSPIAAILVSDSPFGLVDDATVARHGSDVLRRIGVGWGFTVVTDDLPTGPDHDLPDETAWWDSFDTEPQRLTAVRDLDLVDPDRWRDALSLLSSDPAIASLLTDREGYTAWWLRSFAEVDGHPLGAYRAPDDDDLAGLLDPLDHPDAASVRGALAGADIDSMDHAALILDRLADPGRSIAPGVVAGAHASLVRAHRRGVLDLDRLDAPRRVRTLAGDTSTTAVVLDRPWLLQVLDPAEVVMLPAPIDPNEARVLATVLDVATASEDLEVTVVDPGTATTGRASVRAQTDAVLRGHPAPVGEVRLHDSVEVEVLRGDARRVVEVDWWVDDHGVRHLRRS